ncbi:hypothetical protein PR048_008116 [Dryococelus australis]|uniref:Uncharacterized protein n=1 Tax=Dryococelus australis TaxID=614101 RepID=A0ABQ9HX02_9NEOP|nr:hypothetical protein PR048_008116 [Dryococelus australis]
MEAANGFHFIDSIDRNPSSTTQEIFYDKSIPIIQKTDSTLRKNSLSVFVKILSGKRMLPDSYLWYKRFTVKTECNILWNRKPCLEYTFVLGATVSAVAGTLASHTGESGSIPDGVAPKFRRCGNRTRRCHWSAGFSRGYPVFPYFVFFIPALIHTLLVPPSSALKTLHRCPAFVHHDGRFTSVCGDGSRPRLTSPSPPPPPSIQRPSRHFHWPPQAALSYRATEIPKYRHQEVRISSHLLAHASQASLHSPVYTRASAVSSLAAATVLPYTWQYETRYLFRCKFPIGSEASRACLMNCDPIAKRSTSHNKLCVEREAYKPVQSLACGGDGALVGHVRVALIAFLILSLKNGKYPQTRIRGDLGSIPAPPILISVSFGFAKSPQVTAGVVGHRRFLLSSRLSQQPAPSLMTLAVDEALRPTHKTETVRGYVNITCNGIADLSRCSPLVGRRSGVREALGSNPSYVHPPLLQQTYNLDTATDIVA